MYTLYDTTVTDQYPVCLPLTFSVGHSWHNKEFIALANVRLFRVLSREYRVGAATEKSPVPVFVLALDTK